MAFSIKEIEQNKNSESTFDLKGILEKDISLGKGGLNNKKKEAFYSELGVLLNAGINLKDSLSLVKDELKKLNEKQLVEEVINNIVQGSNFSEGIKNVKGITEYEYYSLKIGEETGTLNKVTAELGLFFKRKNEQRKNLMNAVSYPIVVLTTAVLSVFFMLKFVVPMFADIFKQNGVELPFLTKVIISASGIMEKYFVLAMIAFVFLVVFFRTIQKKELYRKLSSSIVLRIPFVGELVRKTYLAQFTQAVALLTSANIPLLNSLQLTLKMIHFYPLKSALQKVESSVLEGEVLSESLRPHKIFGGKMISLIKVAEETNQNEYIFNKLSIQLNDEIQNNSKMLSTVLEPMIIIILGSLVGLILVAMYLPMFKLSTVLG